MNCCDYHRDEPIEPVKELIGIELTSTTVSVTAVYCKKHDQYFESLVQYATSFANRIGAVKGERQDLRELFLSQPVFYCDDDIIHPVFTFPTLIEQCDNTEAVNGPNLPKDESWEEHCPNDIKTLLETSIALFCEHTKKSLWVPNFEKPVSLITLDEAFTAVVQPIIMKATT